MAEFESHISVFPHGDYLSAVSAGTSFPEICRNVSILTSHSGFFETGSGSGRDPWVGKAHSLGATGKQAQAVFGKNTLENLVGLFAE